MDKDHTLMARLATFAELVDQAQIERSRVVLFSSTVLALHGIRAARDIDFSVTIAGADDVEAEKTRHGLAWLNTQTAQGAELDGAILEDLTEERKNFLQAVMKQVAAHQEPYTVASLATESIFNEPAPFGLKATTLAMELHRRALRMRPRCWADLVAVSLKFPHLYPENLRLEKLPDQIDYPGPTRDADRHWSRHQYLTEVRNYLGLEHGLHLDLLEVVERLGQDDPRLEVTSEAIVNKAIKAKRHVLIDMDLIMGAPEESKDICLERVREGLLRTYCSLTLVSASFLENGLELYRELEQRGLPLTALYWGDYLAPARRERFFAAAVSNQAAADAIHACGAPIVMSYSGEVATTLDYEDILNAFLRQLILHA